MSAKYTPNGKQLCPLKDVRRPTYFADLNLSSIRMETYIFLKKSFEFHLTGSHMIYSPRKGSSWRQVTVFFEFEKWNQCEKNVNLVFGAIKKKDIRKNLKKKITENTKKNCIEKRIYNTFKAFGKGYGWEVNPRTEKGQEIYFYDRIFNHIFSSSAFELLSLF